VALLLWLAILTGACACGRQIRAWLRATGEARALEVAYDTALGLGVLAYLVLGLGLVGLLYPWALALAALSLYAVGWRQIPELVRWLREARWPAGRLDSLLWATLVVCAVAALVRNLVPPSSDEWDTLVYHLTAPKQFLQAHRIYFIEHDHHTNFPFNMEMLYLLGLGLHSDRLAKLFHLATYVLCVLALCGAGHSLREPGKGTDTSNAMGAAGAVAFATIPVVAWEAGTAYIDLGLALYGLLAVLAWSEWRQGRGRGWLVAAGLLAGLAFGVKMTGLLVVLFVCGATLLTEAWRRQARQAVASTLLLGAIAVGLASPWYIKTYVYTGNPVFPFFYGVLGGRGWSPEHARTYQEEQQSHGTHAIAKAVAEGTYRRMEVGVPAQHDTPDGSASAAAVRALFRGGDWPNALAAIAVPLLELIDPGRFWEHAGVQCIIGPLFVALLPVLIWLRPLPPSLKALLAYAGFGLFAQTHLSQLSRYQIPFFAAGALGVGYAVAYLGRLGRAPRAAGWLSFGTVSACLLALHLLRATAALPTALGLWTAEDLDAATFESHGAFEYLNAHGGPDAKVAVFGEPRLYRLDVPAEFADRFHNTLYPYENMRTPDDFLSALRARGITHILVNPRYHPGVMGPGPKDRVARFIDALAAEGKLEVASGDPTAQRATFVLRLTGRE